MYYKEVGKESWKKKVLNIFHSYSLRESRSTALYAAEEEKESTVREKETFS